MVFSTQTMTGFSGYEDESTWTFSGIAAATKLAFLVLIGRKCKGMNRDYPKKCPVVAVAFRRRNKLHAFVDDASNRHSLAAQHLEPTPSFLPSANLVMEVRGGSCNFMPRCRHI